MDDEPPVDNEAGAAATEEDEAAAEEKKEAIRKRREELRERALFYLTTFFILLAIVSLFVFLFLVPFLIEPAVSTLLMEFDERPATCVTARSELREGASNCSQPSGWSSCREGCTREIYVCAQIFVNYTVRGDGGTAESHRGRRSRSLLVRGYRPIEPREPDATWAYSYARVFPNVKGCGYPPQLNCTVFQERYFVVGSTYPCYYSRVEPWIVITELDLSKSTRQLIFSVVFPIPCFIVSVVYVALAYFFVYAGHNQKPRIKRRVVRRMVGGSSGGGGVGTVGGSSSRAKTGSEATPLTGNSMTAAAELRRSGSENADDGTDTPGSELLYRDDDDESGTTCYGEQLRSTLAVDDSLSADRLPVNSLRLSENTLRQSECSNAQSAIELWSDYEKNSVFTAADVVPFSASCNSTGYDPYRLINLIITLKSLFLLR